MPSLVVVAGPNGCGKSTLTQIGKIRDIEIIDPDAIARDMRDAALARVEIAAAREALKRRRAAVAAGRSFLIETTLAGQGSLREMKDARRSGFSISLHYVSVASPDDAVLRVRNRVARGGHDVPDEDVRRRFNRSRANLSLAMAISDEWHLYDNTRARDPHRVVAFLKAGHRWTAGRCPAWAAGAVSAEAALRLEMGHKTARELGQQS